MYKNTINYFIIVNIINKYWFGSLNLIYYIKNQVYYNKPKKKNKY